MFFVFGKVIISEKIAFHRFLYKVRKITPFRFWSKSSILEHNCFISNCGAINWASNLRLSKSWYCRQSLVRKTGLQLIIPRIIAVLYAISPLGKKLQTFSRRDISSDFEASFWWNIRTSEVSSICQKLHVGHSQPERMVSNGYRWPDSRSWTYQCHVEVSGKRLKGEKPNHSSLTYLKISWE